MTWFRWRHEERATAPLSRAEFDTLLSKERAEPHSAARDSRRQFVATLLQVDTTVGVLGGLLLTAQGLAQTAKSIDASREELLIARKGLEVSQKGQVTDLEVADRRPGVRLFDRFEPPLARPAAAPGRAVGAVHRRRGQRRTVPLDHGPVAPYAAALARNPQFLHNQPELSLK
jgi:hypothetical protein